MAAKTLYRIRSQKIIGGVCAGFASYFNIDLSLMRLIWIIMGFSGIGIVAYIAALLIVPYNPDENTDEPQPGNAPLSINKKTLGVILIVLGLILFAIQVELFDYLFTFHISWKLVWGLLLILVGVILLLRNFGGEKEYIKDFKGRLIRPRENRMFFGVCAGLANYFKIDVSLMRIFWVLATFAAHGLGLVVYFVFVIVFPSEDSSQEHSTVN